MKTCLVVDDSRVIRKVARRVLEDIGFEIAEAADGMEALAWCRAAMPDAVLLDWNMPVMNGIDFLRQLRAEPGGAAPKVIFCTVENSPDHIRAALEEWRPARVDVINYRKNGELYWNQLTLAPVFSERGALTHFKIGRAHV